MAGQAARAGTRPALELILAHSLRAGLGADGRLPTERQLAQDLGMTRSSVRYALGILEARGQVSREVGRGTYLRSPAGAAGPGRAWTWTAGAGAAGQPRPARLSPPPT